MIRSSSRRLAVFLAVSLTCLAPLAVASQVAAQQAKPSVSPAKPAAAKPAAAKPVAAPAQGAKPAAPGAKPIPQTGPVGSGAVLVSSSGDWGVYTAQAGRSKVCYALTQPKERLPKALTRDPAYLFVSFRPAENVRNEVALVLGFPTKENGPAQASIGQATYALLTKEQNAWLKNPAEESQAIATMAKSQNVTVKIQSRRGNDLTDRYSLNGFAGALERARKECL